MGSQCSGEYNIGKPQHRNLTVVTLSYCGLTSSPFEFYINEYEHQLGRIGQYFQQLIDKDLPAFKIKEKAKEKDEKAKEQEEKAKKIGKLELKFKNRYSPMFNKNAGIELNEAGKGKFVTEDKFKENWDAAFEKEKKSQALKTFLDSLKQNQLTECKQNLFKYDFFMFQALLRYVYKQTQFNFNNIVQKENPQKYLNIISPLFEFSFLNQTNKLSKFEYGFRKTNPDVYFLQQTTQQLVQFLKKRAWRNYRWIGENDGQLIVIKNQSFPGQQYEVVDVQKYFKVTQMKVDKNERFFMPIALGTISKNFLFVSLHFSSRGQVNVQQIKYLVELLENIEKNKEYKCVIMGGNLNVFIKEFKKDLQKVYSFYPKQPTEITTYKKRTKTQAQLSKSDIRDKRSLDKIITNQKLLQCEITLIDGTKPDLYSDEEFKKHTDKVHKDILKQEQQICKQGLASKIKMLLPCEIHPFDKFLVKTTIQVPNFEVPAKKQRKHE